MNIIIWVVKYNQDNEIHAFSEALFRSRLYLLEEMAAGLRMMRYITILLGILYYILLLTPSLCDAEKIYCKDGRVVQAVILFRSKHSVWFEQKFGDRSGSIGISVNDIDRIENDDGSISKYDYKSLYEKSRDHIRQRNYKEAARLYELLLESFPDSIQMHHLCALLNHKIGRLDEAIKDYKFCIRGGVTDVKVFNNLGVIYAKKKEYKEAIEWFSRAIEENSYTIEVHSNLAEVFMQTEDYNRAIYEYKKIIESVPDNAEALYNLGIAYMNEGDYTKAREQWERVLAIRPEDNDAKNALEYININRNAEKIEKSS